MATRHIVHALVFLPALAACSGTGDRRDTGLDIVPGTTDDGGSAGASSDGAAGAPVVVGSDAPDPTTVPEGSDVCEIVTFDPTRVPADIILVLDRSGSMRRTVDGNVPTINQDDKWTEVTRAVNATISATQTDILWGLDMFPMPPVLVPYTDPSYATDTRKCQGDQPPQVPPALSSASDIAIALGGAVPLLDTGATPTAAAVKTASAYLATLQDKNAKYLLLATDGIPNCLGGNDGTVDIQGAIDSVTASAAAGFPVFVVGIAPSGSTANDTLNSMATAGGMPAAGAATQYYSVRSEAELVATLGTITGRAASCTLGFASAPPDPTNIAVEISAQRIDQDASNGWTYGDADMKSVVLHGTACDRLKAGHTEDVVIKFGCPGQPIK